jgi:hypothetical protein
VQGVLTQELVAKAKVLHSAGESVLALAKAHLPLAPAERLEELEKLQGFIRAACQQMVSGPQAFAFEYTRGALLRSIQCVLNSIKPVLDFSTPGTCAVL